MGVGVLVLGHSGSGKSTGLRNFEPDEVGVFNVAGKPLPFRKPLRRIDHARYDQIHAALAQNRLRAYAVDDANYLMAFANFQKAKQRGFDKFVDMAVDFEAMLEAINRTSDDTIVYVMMHPDYDEAGRMKPKTIGRMLDNQLTVEGMFPIVLVCENGEDGYWLRTQSDGSDPAKSPMGMFGERRVPNDLKAVDAAIREYWGMRPLAGGARRAGEAPADAKGEERHDGA